MKANLIKISILLFLVLSLHACIDGEFIKTYSKFKSNLENKNFEAIKRQATKQGITSLEYYFGDLSQNNNQQKFFKQLQKEFSKSYIKKNSSTVIYVLSNKPTGNVSSNTLTFIKSGNVWLLDDYRQGK